MGKRLLGTLDDPAVLQHAGHTHDCARTGKLSLERSSPFATIPANRASGGVAAAIDGHIGDRVGIWQEQSIPEFNTASRLCPVAVAALVLLAFRRRRSWSVGLRCRHHLVSLHYRQPRAGFEGRDDATGALPSDASGR